MNYHYLTPFTKTTPTSFAKNILLITILATSFQVMADDSLSANPNMATSTAASGTTAKYLKNLGDYLGWDLTQDVSFTPVALMLDYTFSVASTGQQLLTTFFGSIPMNGSYPTFATGSSYDAFINNQANTLFKDNYANAGGAPVSVTDGFDQKQYQNDPVTQSILNMVGTPDWSICPATSTNASSQSNSSNPCLSLDLVMATVLQDVTNNDKLPGETNYYNYDSNSKFISQLNSDNLIGPMLYSTSNGGSGTGGQTKGLPSSNQEQQAQDFIRYATGMVLPNPTMSQSDYSDLYNIAYTATTDTSGNPIPGVDANNVMNAKVALMNYLLSLRVYAAKSSVAIGNLYYILSKRMPQTSTDSNGSNSSTSQALSEFQMATWRLYNPQQQASNQWVQQINNASPATVQKEMAILLSEINYQMYLSRQQQERLLMTNSLLLMQMLSSNKPSADFPNTVSQDKGASN